MAKRSRSVAMGLVLSLFLFLAGVAAFAAGAKEPITDSLKSIGFQQTGFPIVKSPVTFKAVYEGQATTTTAWNDMEFFQNLEKKTGVHFQFEVLPAGEATQRKNLILASGDLPDAFILSGDSMTANDLAKYGPEGMFIPVEKYATQYAPNLVKILADHKEVRKVITAPDGHVYSMPSISQDGVWAGANNFFINKKWLDKLGLKVPDTVDELYQVLKAFKTKDPNGNGQADEIPFAFCDALFFASIGPMFGSFGLADPFYHYVVNDQNKLVFVPTQESYKKAIQYFHKYFVEGLMDKEGFTVDPGGWFGRNRGPETLLGSFISYDVSEPIGPERAAEYVPVKPLAGPDGKRSWPELNLTNNGIYPAGLTITKSCKYPEVLVRWADALYETQTTLEAMYGPLGKVIDKNADGTFTFHPLPAGTTLEEMREKYAPGGVPVAAFASDLGKTIPVNPNNATKFKIINQYYKQYMTSRTPPGAFLTAEENDAFGSRFPDISNFTEQKLAEWLIDGGIDTEWNAYLAALDKMGLKEMTAAWQSSYDRYEGR